jgi:hypothetical protein
MRKFIGHTVKGKTSVYECEVSAHYPRLSCLSKNEELYRLLEPKQFNGEFWYSFFFFDTAEEAIASVKQDIRMTYERNMRKNGVQYVENDIENAVANVEIRKLK